MEADSEEGEISSEVTVKGEGGEGREAASGAVEGAALALGGVVNGEGE